MKTILMVATALMALTVTAHAAGHNKSTTTPKPWAPFLNKTYFFE